MRLRVTWGRVILCIENHFPKEGIMFKNLFFRATMFVLALIVLLPLVGCAEPVYYVDTSPPPVVYTEYNYFGVPYYYWYWGGVRYHSYRHPHRHHHRHYPILPPPHVRTPPPHRSAPTDPPGRQRELRRPVQPQPAPTGRVAPARPQAPPPTRAPTAVAPPARSGGRDTAPPRERPH